jgi:hypothetical protein
MELYVVFYSMDYNSKSSLQYIFSGIWMYFENLDIGEMPLYMQATFRQVLWLSQVPVHIHGVTSKYVVNVKLLHNFKMRYCSCY